MKFKIIVNDHDFPISEVDKENNPLTIYTDLKIKPEDDVVLFAKTDDDNEKYPDEIILVINKSEVTLSFKRKSDTSNEYISKK